MAESGDKVFTVRCGGCRFMTVENVRELCEIADKHCDGFLRFTTRNNIEFMVDSQDKMEALKKDLQSRKHVTGSNKFPIGGDRRRVSPISFIPRALSIAIHRQRTLPVWSSPSWMIFLKNSRV